MLVADWLLRLARRHVLPGPSRPHITERHPPTAACSHRLIGWSSPAPSGSPRTAPVQRQTTPQSSKQCSPTPRTPRTKIIRQLTTYVRLDPGSDTLRDTGPVTLAPGVPAVMSAPAQNGDTLSETGQQPPPPTAPDPQTPPTTTAAPPSPPSPPNNPDHDDPNPNPNPRTADQLNVAGCPHVRAEHAA